MAERHQYLFLCLNDNMEGEELEIKAAQMEVRAFLSAMFPLPSPFELPGHNGRVGRRIPFSEHGPAVTDACGAWCLCLFALFNVALLGMLIAILSGGGRIGTSVRRRLRGARARSPKELEL